MNTKKIAKYTLLIFVALSISFLIYDELNKKQNLKTEENKKNNKTEMINPSSCRGETGCDNGLDYEVFAYYFHGYKRCYTCKTIEANIESTLKSEFEDTIKSGVLKWESINVQKPENSHFVKDFDLKFSTLVVGDSENGKIKEWKRLDGVWKLVRDKPAFSRYVSQAISEYLKKGAAL